MLNYLGKVAEKIITTRLFFLAESTNLLNSDQMSGRRQKSVINAVLSLIHDIQLAKHEKRVTSVLFINIKRAFNHVSINQMLRIC